jgi:multiple sugar transport system substrate-binding protein
MKRIATCLLLGLAVIALANGQAKKTGEGTLELMYWDNVQKPVIDKALADFTAQNPKIKVNATVIPWGQYWQKLQTTTFAGNAPDVFWMNVPNFPKYSSANALLNLQPMLQREKIDPVVYPTDLIKKYSKDSNVYAIPEQFDTIALAYNKKMFDEAKIPYPDESWDWNKLREVAIKLTKDTPQGKQYGFLATYGNQNGYYNFMVMNGGEILSADGKKSGFDKKASIDAIKFLINLMYIDKCAPTGQQLYELNQPEDMFNSGKAAMVTIGSWMVPTVYGALGKDVDVAPLPKSPATGTRKSIIHGLAWAGYAKTKNPIGTEKLLQFLISKDFSQRLAQSAITIPSYEGTVDAWVKAVPSMNLKVFIDALKYTSPYPVSKKTAEWQAVEARELKDAWCNNKSPEDAMNTVAKEMDAILATEK